MDNHRSLLAIVLSVAVLLAWQYFFLPPPQSPPVKSAGEAVTPAEESSPLVAPSPGLLGMESGIGMPAIGGEAAISTSQAREITVETDLYTAVISEAGGVVKSFRLKGFREEAPLDSPSKELVKTGAAEGLPLLFSWGTEPGRAEPLLFSGSEQSLVLSGNKEKQLTLTALSAAGLEITRTYTFRADDYRFDLAIEVRNTSDTPIQGAPYLALVSRPFNGGAKKGAVDPFLFIGPKVLLDDAVVELKVKELAKERSGRNFTGRIGWAGYEDTYFMTTLIPLNQGQATAHFAASGDERVYTVLAGAAEIIPPQGTARYAYAAYFGPKKVSLLKEQGQSLERAVNFGWFDVLARPTLFLLNFFHGLVNNYGIAIILVTILIKLAFWPISHKGMKSMKMMQKIQPKMAKVREKFKDDRERQQQEMLKLYQTYKVNPLGGCLPMLLQIPVFFALYKVLLQSIELRHAPFMLWISDLSAPDRLPIGVDIPWLGGIPVLTLLMGGSMFLQQKMTPTTGDPMQAKIMMFLPVIFTFMFLNFASGLVLYWLVNNLLTIGQQYMINRQPS